MELNKILEALAKGEITAAKAKDLIQSVYAKVASKDQDANFSASKPESPNATEPPDSFMKAFDRLRKNRNIDDLIKASSGLVQQITENVPTQIEKLQENVLQDMNFAGFSANIKGISSKFSVFRSFEVSSCSTVNDNQTVGSQWFGVHFTEGSVVNKNKFTAVQFSEFSTKASEFENNMCALSRVSHVTLDGSKMNNNKISRATLSDTVIQDSEILDIKISKSEFKHSTITNSKIKNMNMSGVTFSENELDECVFENLEFENCRFEECVFHKVTLVSKKPQKICDRTIVGKNFHNCSTFEDFVAKLKVPSTNKSPKKQKQSPVSKKQSNPQE